MVKKRGNLDWDEIYSKHSLAEIPWHSDEPDRELIELIENKKIKPCLNPLDRENFATKINKVLKNKGYYYLRCWSDKEEETVLCPYRISKDEIKNTFSKYFKLARIKDFRFGGKGARGYVCLMKKEVYK